MEPSSTPDARSMPAQCSTAWARSSKVRLRSPRACSMNGLSPSEWARATTSSDTGPARIPEAGNGRLRRRAPTSQYIILGSL